MNLSIFRKCSGVCQANEIEIIVRSQKGKARNATVRKAAWDPPAEQERQSENVTG
jgi:hypothetical protein